jgi:hypothetical protein
MSENEAVDINAFKDKIIEKYKKHLLQCMGGLRIISNKWCNESGAVALSLELYNSCRATHEEVGLACEKMRNNLKEEKILRELRESKTSVQDNNVFEGYAIFDDHGQMREETLNCSQEDCQWQFGGETWHIRRDKEKYSCRPVKVFDMSEPETNA